jgi:hypothetical protein
MHGRLSTLAHDTLRIFGCIDATVDHIYALGESKICENIRWSSRIYLQTYSKLMD